MFLVYTKTNYTNVVVVAHSAKITELPGSTSGHNTFISIHITVPYLLVNLAKTRSRMVMMTSAWFGCIWRRNTP